MNPLVTPSFLFRWSFPVLHIPTLPNRSGKLLDLPEKCRLPSLSELDSVRHFADVRLAWNAEGIGVSVEVRGRTKPLAPSSMPVAANGLTVWIDTRNTQGVHRATRFCHQFCLTPVGGGRKSLDPIAVQIPLDRAREAVAPQDLSTIQLRADIEKEGYRLEAWLPAAVFVGFDPSSSPRLGFHYHVRDNELGDQWLAVGSEFPAASDPSLWQTLELVGA